MAENGNRVLGIFKIEDSSSEELFAQFTNQIGIFLKGFRQETNRFISGLSAKDRQLFNAPAKGQAVPAGNADLVLEKSGLAQFFQSLTATQKGPAQEKTRVSLDQFGEKLIDGVKAVSDFDARLRKLNVVLGGNVQGAATALSGALVEGGRSGDSSKSLQALFESLPTGITLADSDDKAEQKLIEAARLLIRSAAEIQKAFGIRGAASGVQPTKESGAKVAADAIRQAGRERLLVDRNRVESTTKARLEASTGTKRAPSRDDEFTNIPPNELSALQDQLKTFKQAKPQTKEDKILVAALKEASIVIEKQELRGEPGAGGDELVLRSIQRLLPALEKTIAGNVDKFAAGKGRAGKVSVGSGQVTKLAEDMFKALRQQNPKDVEDPKTLVSALARLGQKIDSDLGGKGKGGLRKELAQGLRNFIKSAGISFDAGRGIGGVQDIQGTLGAIGSQRTGRVQRLGTIDRVITSQRRELLLKSRTNIGQEDSLEELAEKGIVPGAGSQLGGGGALLKQLIDIIGRRGKESLVGDERRASTRPRDRSFARSAREGVTREEEGEFAGVGEGRQRVTSRVAKATTGSLRDIIRTLIELGTASISTKSQLLSLTETIQQAQSAGQGGRLQLLLEAIGKAPTGGTLGRGRQAFIEGKPAGRVGDVRSLLPAINEQSGGALNNRLASTFFDQLLKTARSTAVLGQGKDARIAPADEFIVQKERTLQAGGQTFGAGDAVSRATLATLIESGAPKDINTRIRPKIGKQDLATNLQAELDTGEVSTFSRKLLDEIKRKIVAAARKGIRSGKSEFLVPGLDQSEILDNLLKAGGIKGKTATGRLNTAATGIQEQGAAGFSKSLGVGSELTSVLEKFFHAAARRSAARPRKEGITEGVDRGDIVKQFEGDFGNKLFKALGSGLLVSGQQKEAALAGTLETSVDRQIAQQEDTKQLSGVGTKNERNATFALVRGELLKVIQAIRAQAAQGAGNLGGVADLTGANTPSGIAAAAREQARQQRIRGFEDQGLGNRAGVVAGGGFDGPRGPQVFTVGGGARPEDEGQVGGRAGGGFIDQATLKQIGLAATKMEILLKAASKLQGINFQGLFAAENVGTAASKFANIATSFTKINSALRGIVDAINNLQDSKLDRIADRLTGKAMGRAPIASTPAEHRAQRASGTVGTGVTNIPDFRPEMRALEAEMKLLRLAFVSGVGASRGDDDGGKRRDGGGGRRGAAAAAGGGREGEIIAATLLANKLKLDVVGPRLQDGTSRVRTQFEMRHGVGVTAQAREGGRLESILLRLASASAITEVPTTRVLSRKNSVDEAFRQIFGGLQDRIRTANKDRVKSGGAANAKLGDIIDLEGLKFSRSEQRALNKTVVPGRDISLSIQQQFKLFNQFLLDLQRRIGTGTSGVRGAPRQTFQEITGGKDVLLSIKDQSGKTLDTFATNVDRNGKLITKSLSAAGESFNIFQRQARSALRRVLLWGSASFVIFGVVRQLSNMVRVTGEVDERMRKLQFLMNSVQTDFTRLGKSSFSVAREFGRSINETLDAMVVFAQQGRTQAEVLELVRSSLLAANQTELSTVQATEALTAAMKIFNFTASESVRIIDSWANVANNNAVTATVLANALKRVGATASLVGVNFHEFNALVTTVAETTRKSGEQIGTSLKFIFQAVQRPETVELLEKLGVAVFSTRDRIRPLLDIMDDLKTRFSTLSDAQQVQVLRSIASRRHFADLAVILKGLDTIQDKVRDSSESFGVAQRNNAIVMEGFNKRIQQVKTSLAEAGVNIASSGIISGVLTLTNVVGGLASILATVPTALGGLTFAFGGLAFGLNLVSRLFIGMGGQGLPSFVTGLNAASAAQVLLKGKSEAATRAILSESRTIDALQARLTKENAASPTAFSKVARGRIAVQDPFFAQQTAVATGVLAARKFPALAPVAAEHIRSQRSQFRQIGIIGGGITAAAFANSFADHIRKNNDFGKQINDVVAEAFDAVSFAGVGITFGALLGGAPGAAAGGLAGAAIGLVGIFDSLNDTMDETIARADKLREQFLSQIDAVGKIKREIETLTKSGIDKLSGDILFKEFPVEKDIVILQNVAQAIANLGQLQNTSLGSANSFIESVLGTSTGIDADLPINNITRALREASSSTDALDHSMGALQSTLDELSRASTINFFAQLADKMSLMTKEAEGMESALKRGLGFEGISNAAAGVLDAIGQLPGPQQGFFKEQAAIQRGAGEGFAQRNLLNRAFGENTGFDNQQVRLAASLAARLEKFNVGLSTITDRLKEIDISDPNKRVSTSNAAVAAIFTGGVSAFGRDLQRAGVEPQDVKIGNLNEVIQGLRANPRENTLLVQQLESLGRFLANIQQATATRNINTTRDSIAQQLIFNDQEGFTSGAAQFIRNGKIDNARLTQGLEPGLEAISQTGDLLQSAIIDSVDNDIFKVIMTKQRDGFQEGLTEIQALGAREVAKLFEHMQDTADKFQLSFPGQRNDRFFTSLIQDVQKGLRELGTISQRILTIQRKNIKQFTDELAIAKTITESTIQSTAALTRQLSAGAGEARQIVKAVFGAQPLAINNIQTRDINISREQADVFSARQGQGSILFKQAIEKTANAQSSNTSAMITLTGGVRDLTAVLSKQILRGVFATQPSSIQTLQSSFEEINKASNPDAQRKALQGFLDVAGPLRLNEAQVLSRFETDPQGTIAGLGNRVNEVVNLRDLGEQGKAPSSLKDIARALAESVVGQEPAGLLDVIESLNFTKVIISRAAELAQQEGEDTGKLLNPLLSGTSVTADLTKNQYKKIQKIFGGENIGAREALALEFKDPEKVTAALFEIEQILTTVRASVVDLKKRAVDIFPKQAALSIRVLSDELATLEQRQTAIRGLTDSFSALFAVGEGDTAFDRFAKQLIDLRSTLGSRVGIDSLGLGGFSTGLAERLGFSSSEIETALQDAFRGAEIGTIANEALGLESAFEQLKIKSDIFQDINTTTEATNKFRQSIETLATKVDPTNKEFQKLVATYRELHDIQQAQSRFFDDKQTRLLKNYAEQLIEAGVGAAAFSDQLRGIIKSDPALLAKAVEKGIIPGVANKQLEEYGNLLSATVASLRSMSEQSRQTTEALATIFDPNVPSIFKFATETDVDPIFKAILEMREGVNIIRFQTEIVGGNPFPSPTSPTGFQLPRVHSGGLFADETLAILQKGEAVIPRALVSQLPHEILGQLPTQNGVRSVQKLHGGLAPHVDLHTQYPSFALGGRPISTEEALERYKELVSHVARGGAHRDRSTEIHLGDIFNEGRNADLLKFIPKGSIPINPTGMSAIAFKTPSGSVIRIGDMDIGPQNRPNVNALVQALDRKTFENFVIEELPNRPSLESQFSEALSYEQKIDFVNQATRQARAEGLLFTDRHSGNVGLKPDVDIEGGVKRGRSIIIDPGAITPFEQIPQVDRDTSASTRKIIKEISRRQVTGVGFADLQIGSGIIQNIADIIFKAPILQQFVNTDELPPKLRTQIQSELDGLFDVERLKKSGAKLTTSAGLGATEAPAPVFVNRYGRKGAAKLQGIIEAINKNQIPGIDLVAPDQFKSLHQALTGQPVRAGETIAGATYRGGGNPTPGILLNSFNNAYPDGPTVIHELTHARLLNEFPTLSDFTNSDIYENLRAGKFTPNEFAQAIDHIGGTQTRGQTFLDSLKSRGLSGDAKLLHTVEEFLAIRAEYGFEGKPNVLAQASNVDRNGMIIRGRGKQINVPQEQRINQVVKLLDNFSRTANLSPLSILDEARFLDDPLNRVTGDLEFRTSLGAEDSKRAKLLPRQEQRIRGIPERLGRAVGRGAAFGGGSSLATILLGGAIGGPAGAAISGLAPLVGATAAGIGLGGLDRRAVAFARNISGGIQSTGNLLFGETGLEFIRDRGGKLAKGFVKFSGIQSLSQFGRAKPVSPLGFFDTGGGQTGFGELSGLDPKLQAQLDVIFEAQRTNIPEGEAGRALRRGEGARQRGRALPAPPERLGLPAPTAGSRGAGFTVSPAGTVFTDPVTGLELGRPILGDAALGRDARGVRLGDAALVRPTAQPFDMGPLDVEFDPLEKRPARAYRFYTVDAIYDIAKRYARGDRTAEAELRVIYEDLPEGSPGRATVQQAFASAGRGDFIDTAERAKGGRASGLTTSNAGLLFDSLNLDQRDEFNKLIHKHSPRARKTDVRGRIGDFFKSDPNAERVLSVVEMGMSGEQRSQFRKYIAEQGGAGGSRSSRVASSAFLFGAVFEEPLAELLSGGYRDGDGTIDFKAFSEDIGRHGIDFSKFILAERVTSGLAGGIGEAIKKGAGAKFANVAGRGFGLVGFTAGTAIGAKGIEGLAGGDLGKVSAGILRTGFGTTLAGAGASSVLGGATLSSIGVTGAAGGIGAIGLAGPIGALAVGILAVKRSLEKKESAIQETSRQTSLGDDFDLQFAQLRKTLGDRNHPGEYGGLFSEDIRIQAIKNFHGLWKADPTGKRPGAYIDDFANPLRLEAARFAHVRELNRETDISASVTKFFRQFDQGIAPRLQTGGMASNEFMAILHKGEAVIPSHLVSQVPSEVLKQIPQSANLSGSFQSGVRPPGALADKLTDEQLTALIKKETQSKTSIGDVLGVLEKIQADLNRDAVGRGTFTESLFTERARNLGIAGPAVDSKEKDGKKAFDNRITRIAEGSPGIGFAILGNQFSDLVSTQNLMDQVSSLVKVDRLLEDLTGGKTDVISDQRLSAISSLFGLQIGKDGNVSSSDPQRLPELFAQKGGAHAFRQTLATLDETFADVAKVLNKFGARGAMVTALQDGGHITEDDLEHNRPKVAEEFAKYAKRFTELSDDPVFNAAARTNVAVLREETHNLAVEAERQAAILEAQQSSRSTEKKTQAEEILQTRTARKKGRIDQLRLNETRLGLAGQPRNIIATFTPLLQTLENTSFPSITKDMSLENGKLFYDSAHLVPTAQVNKSVEVLLARIDEYTSGQKKITTEMADRLVKGSGPTGSVSKVPDPKALIRTIEAILANPLTQAEAKKTSSDKFSGVSFSEVETAAELLRQTSIGGREFASVQQILGFVDINGDIDSDIARGKRRGTARKAGNAQDVIPGLLNLPVEITGAARRYKKAEKEHAALVQQLQRGRFGSPKTEGNERFIAAGKQIRQNRSLNYDILSEYVSSRNSATVFAGKTVKGKPVFENIDLAELSKRPKSFSADSLRNITSVTDLPFEQFVELGLFGGDKEEAFSELTSSVFRANGTSNDKVKFQALMEKLRNAPGTITYREAVSIPGMRKFHSGGVAAEEQVAILEKGEVVVPRALVPTLDDSLMSKIPGGHLEATKFIDTGGSKRKEQSSVTENNMDVTVPTNVEVHIHGGGAPSTDQVHAMMREALKGQDFLKNIMNAPLRIFRH